MVKAMDRHSPHTLELVKEEIKHNNHPLNSYCTRLQHLVTQQTHMKKRKSYHLARLLSEEFASRLKPIPYCQQ